MGESLPPECDFGREVGFRLKSQEKELEDICRRQLESDKALMGVIKEMSKDLGRRLDAIDTANHVRELAWQEKTATLDKRIDQVRDLADVRRAITFAATSLALVVAAGAVAVLLKGCCW